MAIFLPLLPLLRVTYYFSKLFGFHYIYYHAEQQTFKLTTRYENVFELFYSRLMYIINLAGALYFIFLRLRIEYNMEYLNSTEPDFYLPPNYPRALIDAAYAVAYFCNCLFFRHNQQRFVVLGNKLLVIYRALQTEKMQLRFSSMLLLLSYFLFILIIGCFAERFMIIWKAIKIFNLLGFGDRFYKCSLVLLGWTHLLFVLHILLLVLFFVLLTSYYRQLSDMLLKTCNKSIKRSAKLMRILPLLQEVQQQGTRYFSFLLAIYILGWLHAVYCLVNTFKYDEATLHHASIEQRSEEVSDRTTTFLWTMLHLLLKLHALSVCKREHGNLLHIITFPIDAPYIQTTLISDQLETSPDAIVVCNDVEPQRNLFDIMLDTDKPLGSLSLEDTFGLHFRGFKIPLKILKQSVYQICCSTFVLIVFDKLQQLDLKKLEQSYK